MRRLLGGSTVVVLLLAAPLLLDSFGLFLAATIFALGLYGAAFDLLYGYTGLLSFGHSVFFGVGAYAATVAIMDGGAGTVVALVLAFLVAMVVAVGLGVIAIRVTSHGFVIVTILIALVAHLLATSWTSVTGGTDGRTVVVPPVAVPGLGEVSLIDPVARYYFMLAVLTLSLVVLQRLVASPVGLAFRLVRDNERRARLLGYNVAGYKLAAFAASGAFAKRGQSRSRSTRWAWSAARSASRLITPDSSSSSPTRGRGLANDEAARE
ncbi:MAG: branched-chain amino acid ABC transporter permease, partial [Halobacteriales archaeon]|nr:branched-chain amino acid ABC transporter permease [Halobacteriales archaeon]